MRTTLEAGFRAAGLIAIGALILIATVIADPGAHVLGEFGVFTAAFAAGWWLFDDRRDVRAILRRVEPAPAGARLELSAEALRHNLRAFGIDLLLAALVCAAFLLIDDAEDLVMAAGAFTGLGVAKAAAAAWFFAWQRRNGALLTTVRGRRPGPGSADVSYGIPSAVMASPNPLGPVRRYRPGLGASRRRPRPGSRGGVRRVPYA